MRYAHAEVLRDLTPQAQQNLVVPIQFIGTLPMAARLCGNISKCDDVPFDHRGGVETVSVTPLSEAGTQ